MHGVQLASSPVRGRRPGPPTFPQVDHGSLWRTLGRGRPGSGRGKEKKEKKPQVNVDPALLVQEPHVCRGLNTCKGKGKGAKNACAGQGACATVDAHACNGQNDCKAQGGCGGYPGQNTCKGKGHCAVPLSTKTWAIARKEFEHLMGDMSKKVGKAPKKS